MSTRGTLGLVNIPEHTLEHDMTLLERYNEFSGELLRLGLLGITAIGFAASKALFPGEGQTTAEALLQSVQCEAGLSLIAFGGCVAAALAHRYFATDSMSWHLQAMRRYVRAEGNDIEVAKAEFRRRHRQFKRSECAIRVASLSLGTGAVTMAFAIWRLI